MWFITVLALAAVPPIGLRLPGAGLAPNGGLRRRVALLGDRRVLAALARTVVAFTGIYIPYTYVSAIFDGVGHDRLATLLLGFGLAGTVGNLTAGHLSDRRGPERVIIAATLLLAVVFVAMPPSRGSFASALAVVALSGLFSFAVTTPQQHRLITLAGDARAMVGSLYQSALYLAVSLSGAVGAAGLHVLGPARLPLLAALIVLAAAALTWRAALRTE